MRIGTKNINGVDTEVHASPDGVFSIQIDGKSIGSGQTLDSAVAVARNAINRDKTVVNVTFITKTGGERGVATGFHSRNRTIMAKIAGGRSEQLDYNYKAFKADIPKAKLDRWFEVRTELDKLKNEQRELDQAYEITLRAVIQQAITDAQSTTLAGATSRAAARREETATQRRRRY